MHFITHRKVIANVLSALIPHKALRRRVRYNLHPLNDKRCLKYFAREYVLTNTPEYTCLAKQENLIGKDIIWMCWLQGRDTAPPLVEYCLSSVEKYKGDEQEIVIITEANYTEYIALPTFIFQKRNEGKIPDAQFSDLIRTYLLVAYGGYWIDATCLLTASLPLWIQQSETFLYRAHSGDFGFTYVQNCFLRGNAGGYLLQRQYNLMIELWRREKQMLHYFQWHLMFKAMITHDPTAQKLYHDIPQIDDGAMHQLFYTMRATQTLLRCQVDEAAQLTFIHKLTYKLPIRSSDIIAPTR